MNELYIKQNILELMPLLSMQKLRDGASLGGAIEEERFWLA